MILITRLNSNKIQHQMKADKTRCQITIHKMIKINKKMVKIMYQSLLTHKQMIIKIPQDWHKKKMKMKQLWYKIKHTKESIIGTTIKMK